VQRWYYNQTALVQSRLQSGWVVGRQLLVAHASGARWLDAYSLVDMTRFCVNPAMSAIAADVCTHALAHRHSFAGVCHR
jgi:hypothetical protein